MEIFEVVSDEETDIDVEWEPEEDILPQSSMWQQADTEAAEQMQTANISHAYTPSSLTPDQGEEIRTDRERVIKTLDAELKKENDELATASAAKTNMQQGLEKLKSVTTQTDEMMPTELHRFLLGFFSEVWELDKKYRGTYSCWARWLNGCLQRFPSRSLTSLSCRQGPRMSHCCQKNSPQYVNRVSTYQRSLVPIVIPGGFPDTVDIYAQRMAADKNMRKWENS